MVKKFGKVVEKQLVKLWDEWKDVNQMIFQTTLYNQRKAKASYPKAKNNCKKRNLNSQFILDYVVSQTDNSQVQQAVFKRS